MLIVDIKKVNLSIVDIFNVFRRPFSRLKIKVLTTLKNCLLTKKKKFDKDCTHTLANHDFAGNYRIGNYCGEVDARVTRDCYLAPIWNALCHHKQEPKCGSRGPPAQNYALFPSIEKPSISYLRVRKDATPIFVHPVNWEAEKSTEKFSANIRKILHLIDFKDLIIHISKGVIIRYDWVFLNYF